MVAPAIIGGNGYRWRGRGIRTVRRGHSTCVTMPRKDSMVMVPVSVTPKIQYKITITAAKSSGNGALLVNFFGGMNYDGPHISVNVTSAEMRDYTIAVGVPKFPENLSMNLRIFRPRDSTGNIFIKTMQYSRIGGRANIPREPRLPIVRAPKTSRPAPAIKHKKRPAAVQRYKKTEKKRFSPPTPPRVSKEAKVMKFRPYKAGTQTTHAQKVMIKRPGDVPKVSIITPTRDGLELLKKCYVAMNENTGYPNWEWIIGDSESTDGTEAFVKGLKDPRIKFVQRGTTDGSFSSINNELVKFADGEYLLFLNNDTEPQPFWLYEMMSKIHRHPNIGVVGAQLLYSENKIQHAGIAFIPQGPANLGKAVLKSFPKGFATHDRYYQAVTGACMLMRASDFKTVKGFDPIYYFCYEDIDLCLKIRYDLKKKIICAANAKSPII